MTAENIKNMEKTIEEKLEAVRAFCYNQCTPRYTIKDGIIATADISYFDLQIRKEGGFADHFALPKRGNAQPEIVELFYSLLGLAGQSAVETERQKFDVIIAKKNKIAKGYRQQHGYERAKNTALVQALLWLKDNRTPDRAMIEIFIDKAIAENGGVKAR